jgi:hypothetical protein
MAGSEMALPFLFVSFGNRQSSDHHAIAEVGEIIDNNERLNRQCLAKLSRLEI